MVSEEIDLFECARRVTAWLDSMNLPSEHETAMRIIKLQEEAGEVAQAYIGWRGQNPRKGVTHTREQVLEELADVVMTALCAIQHLTQNLDDTREVVEGKARRTVSRVGL